MWKATHSNSWYPIGNELIKSFDNSFKGINIDQSNVKGIISPHAGYKFCLNTASYSFSAIDTRKYNKIFILGPSHRFYMDYCGLICTNSAETPLGNIPIDPISTELISKYPFFFKKLDFKIFEAEHSLEMMLPYLKYIYQDKEFSIIPIICGSLTQNMILEVSNILKIYLNDPNSFLVISSDFVHWGERFKYTYLPPSDENISKRISMIDFEAMNIISKGNPNEFNEFLLKTKATICGKIPITIAMNIFKSNYEIEWPHYSKSSEVINFSDSSVSYCSGIIKLIK